MRLGFSKLLGKLVVKYVITKDTLLKDQQMTYLMKFMQFFSVFLYKNIYYGYSFELHRQVDAIQMCTHNICLYTEVDKKYSGSNLNSTELLDCALIGACVIRVNTVFFNEMLNCIFLGEIMKNYS